MVLSAAFSNSFSSKDIADSLHEHRAPLGVDGQDLIVLAILSGI
jgi:hypothetical protein